MEQNAKRVDFLKEIVNIKETVAYSLVYAVNTSGQRRNNFRPTSTTQTT